MPQLCDFPNCWNKTETCIETEDGTRIYYCHEHDAEETLVYVLEAIKLMEDKEE